jgi:nucleoside recognition membrane protein YjiH
MTHGFLLNCQTVKKFGGPLQAPRTPSPGRYAYDAMTWFLYVKGSGLLLLSAMLFANLEPVYRSDEFIKLVDYIFIFILRYIFSMVYTKLINNCGFGFPVKQII